MNRRTFFALASGLLVPDWLLDPPKGRSMVSVPGMPLDPNDLVLTTFGKHGEPIIISTDTVEMLHWPTKEFVKVPRSLFAEFFEPVTSFRWRVSSRPELRAFGESYVIGGAVLS